MTRKSIILMTLWLSLSLSAYSQQSAQAKQILDKCAAQLNSSSGASAQFTISSQGIGNTTGTIRIKGSKFQATTPTASIWFDGKTQWTYMKNTDEVNVSHPDEHQQAQMNPYKFITLYKTGYRLSVKTQSGGWQVHLVSLTSGRTIQEMYVTVNKSYLPTTIKLREGKQWSTITVSNFKASPQDDSLFTFNAKDFPSAEIIDLR